VADMRAPFPPEFVEWVFQRKAGEKRAVFAANVDHRHYMDRLDEVGLPWHDEYTPITEDWTVVRCDLTVGDRTLADYSEQDAGSKNIVTSSIAQSFKRAAAKFGLGRDLYFLPADAVYVNEYNQPTQRIELPPWYLIKCGIKTTPKVEKTTAEAAKEAADALFGKDEKAARDHAHFESLDENGNERKPASPQFSEWIMDEKNKRSWWAQVQDKFGKVTADDVRDRLGVPHIHEAQGTVAEVWMQLEKSFKPADDDHMCPIHKVAMTEKTRKADGIKFWSHKDGDAWCNGKAK
jgi:hypothetical protein